jgi:serine/threonine protein kinase
MRHPPDPSLDLAHRIASGELPDADALDRLDPKLARGLRRMATITRALTPHAPTGATWGHLTRLELAGGGTFGEVFRAYDPTLARTVALKLRRRDAPGVIFSGRDFVAEAQRLASVRHPNVLAVHGASYHDDRAGLWADWIDGETLHARLEREGRLPMDVLLPLARDLASALAAVHAAGLVHGDVKASNVMIDASGHVVLMDFGAGFRSGDEGAVLGAATPQYLAPEIAAGEAASTAVDLYALGVLLHRAAAAQYPIGDSVHANIRPAALRSLLGELLSPEARRRPAAATVVERLDHLRAAPLRRARRVALYTLFAGAIAVAAISTLAYLRSEKLRREAENARDHAEATTEFLHDLLGRAAPNALGPRASMRDLLDSAPQLIEQHFADRPHERLAATVLLADLEADFANDRVAAAHSRSAAAAAAALDPDSDQTLRLTAQSLRRRAIAGEAQAVLPEAEALLARAERERRDPAVIAAIEQALAEVESRTLLIRADPALSRRMLDRLRRVVAPPVLLDARAECDALRRLSSALIETGDHRAGTAVGERAVARAAEAFGADHALTALNRRVLGWTVLDSQAERAESLFRTNLTMHERKLGRHSAAVADDLMGLSYALGALRRVAEALASAEESWRLTNEIYGSAHRSTIDAGLTLANALELDAQYDRSAALIETLRERLRDARGSENRQYLLATRQLAFLMRARGRPDLAPPYFAECADIGLRVLGADNPLTRTCVSPPTDDGG